MIANAEAEREAAAFLAWLAAERILPQYILYAPDEIARYRDLRARGVIPGERHFLLFVLGRHGSGESAPRDLLPFVMARDADPSDPSPWAACAFGARESACAMTAAALGGHVRVGFENNLRLADGRLAPDNAALVAQARDGAAILGREIASAATARDMLWAP